MLYYVWLLRDMATRPNFRFSFKTTMRKIRIENFKLSFCFLSQRYSYTKKVDSAYRLFGKLVTLCVINSEGGTTQSWRLSLLLVRRVYDYPYYRARENLAIWKTNSGNVVKVRNWQGESATLRVIDMGSPFTELRRTHYACTVMSRKSLFTALQVYESESRKVIWLFLALLIARGLFSFQISPNSKQKSVLNRCIS